MTLPLLDSQPAPTVRCVGIRANGHTCGRALHDAESVARGIGPDCAERMGLIPPRRYRVAAVTSGAAEATLFEINEGEPAMMICVCGGCGEKTKRPAVQIERVDGGGGIPLTTTEPDHLCADCAKFVYAALAGRKKAAA